MLRLSALLLIPLVALPQTAPNSVTVMATRTIAAQPDLTRFTILVSAPADATLEEVVAAASAAGVSTANFSSVSTFGATSDAQPVSWSFSITAPVAKLKQTIGLLTAVQNSLARDKKFALSFSVNGS